MIPKKIHYCWFGNNKLPESAENCIDTWKKFLPEYEIIEWNEQNFDINSNQYVKEAYEAKRYAFVTDYVRLYALYKYGGIYMDTDVEVVKPLDKFLINKAFTGCENENMSVTGTMAAIKGHSWIKELLDYYKDQKFILEDGSHNTKTNTKIITEITIENYGWKQENTHQILKDDLHIYPYDVFCAKNFKTGKIEKTENTHTIHHFAGSWHRTEEKFKAIVIKILGAKNVQSLKEIKQKMKWGSFFNNE